MSQELPNNVKQLFADKAKELKTIKEISIEPIYQGCAQMARVKEVGGPVGYGVRACAASIIKLTKEQDYSVLSANDPHPELIEEQTHNMIVNSVTDNPSTCERFESFNEGGCSLCQFKGKIKSPVTLGKKSLDLEPAKVVIQLSDAKDTSETDYETIAFRKKLAEHVSFWLNDNLDRTVSLMGGTEKHKGEYPVSIPVKSVRASMNTDLGYVAIEATTLLDWFGIDEEQDDFALRRDYLTRDLTEHGCLISVEPWNLLKGTSFRSGKLMCYVFDLSKL